MALEKVLRLKWVRKEIQKVILEEERYTKLNSSGHDKFSSLIAYLKQKKENLILKKEALAQSIADGEEP